MVGGDYGMGFPTICTTYLLWVYDYTRFRLIPPKPKTSKLCHEGLLVQIHSQN